MGLASKLREAEAQRAAQMTQAGMAAPPPQQGAPPPPVPTDYYNIPVTYGSIMEHLEHCVQDQHLSAFYPPGSLEQIARVIEQRQIVNTVARHWRLPLTLATEMVKMALFDFVLYIDDSGSMRRDTRIDQLKDILSRIAFVVALFDDDGYSLRFINADLQGEHIRTAADALALVENQAVAWRYQTPVGTQLHRRILQPLVVQPAQAGRLRKPVVVVTITDGKPEGEPANTIFDVLKHVNQDLGKTRYGPDAISYQFAQVGDDLQAAEFLRQLDEHREVGSLVDCTSSYEVEQMEMGRVGAELTPELWTMKLLMGPIDASYDQKDEGWRGNQAQGAPAGAPAGYGNAPAGYGGAPAGYGGAPAGAPGTRDSGAPAKKGHWWKK